MGDLVFNVAKGHLGYYGSLPGASDAIKWMLLKADGLLVTDSAMYEYNTVSGILAGTSNELTDASYVRKTAASVTFVIDDTNNRIDVDCADVSWTTLAGTDIAAAVSFYVPNTAAESDATNVPLTKHDFAVGLPATPVTLQIPLLGFARISS